MSFTKNKKLIAQRYAKALFISAKDLESCMEDFTSFMEVLFGGSDLIQTQPLLAFLQNKMISKEKRQDVVVNSMKAAGFSIELVKAVNVLLAKSRESLIVDFYKEFQLLYLQSKSQINVDLIAAKEIDSETEALLKNIAERVFNKSVNISKKINPDVIGGFILKSRSFMLDASLKREISVINHIIKHREVVNG